MTTVRRPRQMQRPRGQSLPQSRQVCWLEGWTGFSRNLQSGGNRISLPAALANRGVSRDQIVTISPLRAASGRSTVLTQYSGDPPNDIPQSP